MVAFIFNPTKTFRHEARFWALRVLVCSSCMLCICYFEPRYFYFIFYFRLFYSAFCVRKVKRAFLLHIRCFRGKSSWRPSSSCPLPIFGWPISWTVWYRSLPIFSILYVFMWATEVGRKEKVIRRTSFLSTGFFNVFFSDANYCVEKFLGIRALMACLPPWFRFAQCMRRYRDTKEAFPHIANAVKYATSFFVVIFSTLNKIDECKYNLNSITFYI